MPPLRRGAGLLAASALLSCSSLSAQELYQKMTLEARMGFISQLPELRESERDDFLGRQPRPKTLPPEKSYTLVRMDIAVSETLPITAGREVPLYAIVHYADGRKADVTHLSDWKVQPGVVTLQGSTLRYGCLASEVEVAANFLNEREGFRIISFKKPLERLEIALLDPTSSVESSETYRLTAIATCWDGTVTDVSCQVDWKSRTPGIELGVCGQIRIPFGKPHRAENKIDIDAAYGGIKASTKIHLPELSLSR